MILYLLHACVLTLNYAFSAYSLLSNFHCILLRYKVTKGDFRRIHGGAALLGRHPPSHVLAQAFPEHDFLPWLFNYVRPGYWDEPENRLKYLLWLKKKVALDSLSQLNSTHFIQNKGAGLLAAYGGSSMRVIDSVSSLISDSKEMIDSFGVIRKDSVHKPLGYWVLSLYG